MANPFVRKQSQGNISSISTTVLMPEDESSVNSCRYSISNIAMILLVGKMVIILGCVTYLIVRSY